MWVAVDETSRRGRWVAVGQFGDVVTDADELGSLLEQLAEFEVTADIVQRLPRGRRTDPCRAELNSH